MLDEPGSGHKLLDHLVRDINRYLVADKKLLIRNEKVPAQWEPKLFQRLSKDESMWYRSTLLVAVIGFEGGILATVGDGGVRVIVKRDDPDEAVERELLRAVEGAELESYVGWDLKSYHFQTYRINVKDGRRRTTLFLASDGLDTTMQRKSQTYSTLPNSNREALLLLKTLSHEDSTTPDNLSLCRLTWPSPREGVLET